MKKTLDIKKYQHDWYLANKERIRITHRVTNQTYQRSEKGKVAKRRYREKPIARYKDLINRSTRLYHLKCEFSFEEFLKIIKFPCFYCGGSLPIYGSGIDRIDSNLGYTIENIRPCCTICNIAKNASSEDAFRLWIIRVFKHWIKV